MSAVMATRRTAWTPYKQILNQLNGIVLEVFNEAVSLTTQIVAAFAKQAELYLVLTWQ